MRAPRSVPHPRVRYARFSWATTGSREEMPSPEPAMDNGTNRFSLESRILWRNSRPSKSSKASGIHSSCMQSTSARCSSDRTTGWADVQARDGALLLTLELRAFEETEVVVEFDPPSWDLTGFERSKSDGAVQIGRGHLNWKHNGVGTYRLQWRSTKEDEVGPSLRLKLRAGERWHEHVLPTID